MCAPTSALRDKQRTRSLPWRSGPSTRGKARAASTWLAFRRWQHRRRRAPPLCGQATRSTASPKPCAPRWQSTGGCSAECSPCGWRTSQPLSRPTRLAPALCTMWCAQRRSARCGKRLRRTRIGRHRCRTMRRHRLPSSSRACRTRQRRAAHLQRRVSCGTNSTTRRTRATRRFASRAASLPFPTIPRTPGQRATSSCHRWSLSTKCKSPGRRTRHRVRRRLAPPSRRRRARRPCRRA